MKTIIFGYSVFLIIIGSGAFASGWDAVDAWFFTGTALCAVVGIFIAFRQRRLRRAQEVRE